MSAHHEKREFPRAEVFAQVQISQDAEVHIMSTSNISRGGVFIQGSPADYPDLRVGAVVDLQIFASEGSELGDDVSCRAKVVRTQPVGTKATGPGFGLQFLDIDPENVRRLEALLRRTSGR
ncbi:MAG: PilZ domain-containing protein [Deltaproteobacteria bacterium]|nr:PilZ domain-containing protein [Deltaproteobacteria bacterium]